MPIVPQTTLLAVRHGETRWNAENRFQGHGDSPLTKTGRRQITALGRRLRAVAFDHLVCSDLGRARESAALIAAATGHPVEADARLRERHYGVLEGLNVPEIEAAHADVLSRFSSGDPDYVIPGGESHRMHYARNIAWVEAALTERPGAVIVLVVHGGVLDSLFRYVTGLPLSRPRCFVTTNASLSVFAHGRFYGSVRWVIQTWGDAAHLDDIGHYRGLG